MAKANRSKILTTLATLVIAASFMLTPAAQAGDTIKIGGMFAVTGGASFLGDPEKKSMLLAIEEINANGGVCGKKLEAVVYDTEGKDSKAITAADKLINKDQVVAIVGPSRTPCTLPVIPRVERSKVPFISCAASVKIVQPVKPYVFKTAQSDTMAVRTVYKCMQGKGLVKAALLTVENPFGASGRTQLQNEAASFGIKLVADETFSNNDPDMKAQLTKIRKAAPDAIIVWGTNPGPAKIAKNAKELKMDIPMFNSHGVASPKFIELAGDAAEGIMLPTGKILVAESLPEGDHQKPVLMNYKTKYEAKYNASVSPFGGYGWDGVMLLKQALAGTDGDRQKVRDNLEKIIGMVGVTGTYNMSTEDHNGLGDDCFTMVVIKDGKFELLK